MSDGDVLAVDVGATTIKFGRFDATGSLVARPSRRTTPYPCEPERLVTIIANRALQIDGVQLGVGFPGEVNDGVVLDAANLTRPTGPSGDVDEELAGRWRGFDFRGALTAATSARVVVRNDAAMAALGCMSGSGVELVVTLGTGCGLALVREGELVAVRDVGGDVLVGSSTYDDLLGERGRRPDEEAWLVHVVQAVTELANEFSATTIHLAGGNARRVSPYAFGQWSDHLVIERDNPALVGAWRACQP